MFVLIFGFNAGWFLSSIHAIVEVFLFYLSELLLLVFGLQTSLFTGAFASNVEVGFWIKRVHIDVFVIIF